MEDLTHFNSSGRARMVNVSEKDKTTRIAIATATVHLNESTYTKILDGQMKKGDVLSVAQVAGIIGAKQTSSIIPMCHPISLTGVDIDFITNDEEYTITIESTAQCVGETGVEMEALSAASIAALTIYDMCKAIQRDIEITDIHLVKKSGGKSGLFEFNK